MSSLSYRQRFLVLFLAIGSGLLAWSWDELDPLLRGTTVLVVVLVTATAVFGRAAQPTQQPAEPRLDLVERVLADETRRPWDASTLPWPRPGGSPKPILLVPAADYHLAEIVPIARELNRREIPTRIAVGISPWERTWPALSAYPDLEVFALPEAEDLAGEVSAVLVMKDTGSLQPFVQTCRELGIPTMGKVEGAQDFWDSDTPNARLPYRSLDLVLCQGQFDSGALGDRVTAVVGSTRLERLWWAPPAAAVEPLAVINLNFVYGVRTADRKLWLESAIEGCNLAGVPYVISLHPAEKAKLDSPRATSISASRLLPRATVLVSRFSTMPFEAMARGIPFVYHNPHGETVPTFADAMGAFETTTSASELGALLPTLTPGSSEVRPRAQPFFAHHIDIDPSRRSEQRSADLISETVRA